MLCEDLKSEWLKRVCTPLSLTLSQSSHSEQHSLPQLPSELHTVLTATVSKQVSHVECIVRHAFNDKTFQDSFNLSFSLFAILFFSIHAPAKNKHKTWYKLLRLLSTCKSYKWVASKRSSLIWIMNLLTSPLWGFLLCNRKLSKFRFGWHQTGELDHLHLVNTQTQRYCNKHNHSLKQYFLWLDTLFLLL